MGLSPPSYTFDIEIVIDIYVVGRAVAAAGATSEGEGRHEVVVDGAQCSDRARRVHDDPPRVHHLTELADDLIVTRENDCRVSQPAGMVHVDTNLERLVDRLRSIDREHREQLLDRKGMFAAYALNRRNQELSVWSHGKTGKTGDIGSLLPDCHGLHKPGLRID